MKILFIQLPLLDHSRGYIPGNVQYAPATLSAYIKTNFTDKYKTDLLSFEITSFASDKIILEEIIKKSPGMILFTCYLWNIERHLYLAESIKKVMPHITIIFGGPEISLDQYLLEKNIPVLIFLLMERGNGF